VTDANDAQSERPTAADQPAEHRADNTSRASDGEATPASKSEQRADRKADRKAARAERRRSGGEKVKAGADAVRSRMASLVWLVAVLAALFLAVGALLVALKMNQQNAIVKFVLDVAKAIDLGVFKDYTGKGAATKEALTDWGIAAVIYLVIGKILDRLIRP
jgi:uncharacterized membrane protein